MSTDLDQVIQRDDEMYDLKGEDVPPPAAPKTTPTRLSKIIDAQASAVEAPEDSKEEPETVPADQVPL